MRYPGGKFHFVKHIVPVLKALRKQGQPFVDLFCGACNIVAHRETICIEFLYRIGCFTI